MYGLPWGILLSYDDLNLPFRELTLVSEAL